MDVGVCVWRRGASIALVHVSACRLHKVRWNPAPTSSVKHTPHRKNTHNVRKAVELTYSMKDFRGYKEDF